jgi:hypothetical protein
MLEVIDRLARWCGVNLAITWATCCLCITNTSGFSGRSKHKIEYPNIPSALRPILHDDSIPVPEPQENYTLGPAAELEDYSPEAGSSMMEDQILSEYSTKEPHVIRQAGLNDIIRDLDLSKTKKQLPESRLQ